MCAPHNQIHTRIQITKSRLESKSKYKSSSNSKCRSKSSSNSRSKSKSRSKLVLRSQSKSKSRSKSKSKYKSKLKSSPRSEIPNPNVRRDESWAHSSRTILDRWVPPVIPASESESEHDAGADVIQEEGDKPDWKET